MLIIGLFRALRSFQNKESIVGKLFAKHIKLDEAKQFLQRAQCVYLQPRIQYILTRKIEWELVLVRPPECLI